MDTNTELTTISEIVQLSDPRLDAFMDIYQVSLNPREQVLVSHFIRLLRDGPGPDNHLLVADLDAQVVGMAYYRYRDVGELGKICWPWYMAVRPEFRSRGIGGRILQDIFHAAVRAGCTGVLLEVEKPEVMGEIGTQEDVEWAGRRIEFYRRHGARRVDGVRYVQSVGWQPPIEMLLLWHPIQTDMGGEAVFERLRRMLGKGVERTGPVVLA
jgi:GNAT superfamily N-acetyltransferase